VATKCDRLSGNELKKSIDVMRAEYSQAAVVPFSAKTGAGKDELWEVIRIAATKTPNF
jgi:GTPase Era involved in 16S rRNA processing